MFFVAISRPCYQRFAAGAITFARSKRAQTPAAVSPAVIANIERQLNAIAPHHIRVTICVGRGGMAVRIRSGAGCSGKPGWPVAQATEKTP